MVSWTAIRLGDHLNNKKDFLADYLEFEMMSILIV